MNTFDQYLSEDEQYNKWVFDLNYAKHNDDYTTFTSKTLSYALDDGRRITIIAHGENGIPLMLMLHVYSNGRSHSFQQFDMQEEDNDYQTFKTWLPRALDNSTEKIHIYSLPTESQFNELIQPSLSV